MNINKPSRGFYFFKGFFVLTFLCLLSAQGMAANYPLEIIQPQPNLDIKNRFYKAYPGLEYNVRLAVIGGEFPYLFALTSSPTGMSIDKRGEISWANPVASGTPYNVTATVTDAQSNTKNVSWTITVTTTGFRFIDAVNGKSAALGGTGTFANPWKSMKDWYEGDDAGAVDRNSYSGEFLYWRGGTYVMDAAISQYGSVLMKKGNKPQVWLAYPGESPVIDMQKAHFTIWSGHHLYIDGIEFNINGNPRGMGITTPGDASHVTVRRNKFHNLPNGYTGGNNACFFISKEVPGKQGKYLSFQDNEFYDVPKGYSVLGYSAERVLIENNIVHHVSQGIGPKEGTAMWFIRGNTLFNNIHDSIGVQYSDSGGILSGDIEISYNLVEVSGGMVRVNSNQTAHGKPVYVFRNTFLNELVQVVRPTSTNGIFKFYQNVIVNERSDPDHIQRLNVQDASRVIVLDNLTGKSADNIVDADGYLTQGYSSYIGTHGHELGKRPLAPTGFTVTGQ